MDWWVKRPSALRLRPRPPRGPARSHELGVEGASQYVGAEAVPHNVRHAGSLEPVPHDLDKKLAETIDQWHLSGQGRQEFAHVGVHAQRPDLDGVRIGIGTRIVHQVGIHVLAAIDDLGLEDDRDGHGGDTCLPYQDVRCVRAVERPRPPSPIAPLMAREHRDIEPRQPRA
eukprot:4881725-Pleurochrysis_carterae.AAC.1